MGRVFVTFVALILRMVKPGYFLGGPVFVVPKVAAELSERVVPGLGWDGFFDRLGETSREGLIS
jgi:hypothetical protein